MLTFAQATFGNVLRAVSGALTAIRGVVDVFAGLFTGDWSRMWNGVKEIFTGALTLIGAVLRQGLAALQAVAGLAVDAIKAVFRAGWDALSGIVGSALSSTREAASAGIGVLLAVIKTVPARIVAALGNLGGLLVDAGRAVVQGLIDGIDSLAGLLARKVKQIAGAVADAAKSALGIRSPSTVFAEIGGNIAAGMALGLDRSRPGVMRSVTDLVDLTGLRLGGPSFVMDRISSGPAPVSASAETNGLLAEQNALLTEQNKILRAMPRGYLVGMRIGASAARA